MDTFPRIIYHSCDRGAAEQIIQNGLIPGGWPRSTGRAYNYFIATHPWHADMKKLAGTRAGKPFYIAFDLELMIQCGVRLFRTDEALMSPDWVPNECLICVYDASEREFWWSNRAYAACRKAYNERVKQAVDDNEAIESALQESKRSKSMDLLFEHWTPFVNGAQPGRFFSLDKVRRLTGVMKDMENQEGITPVSLDNYMFGLFAAVSNSEAINQNRKRGKGKGRKGKGKGSHPEGKAGINAQLRLQDLDYFDCITAQKITIPFTKCAKCDKQMLDGTNKCPACYASMESWSDNRIATEVRRLESRAKEISGVFAMDQISQIQPRKDRMGSSQRQSGRAGRSNFGVMKDGARKEVRKTKKLGFESIAGRLENDPFFMYNCSLAQLTPPCCEFLEILAGCLSPDHGRSSDARGKGKGTEIRTRLLFTPKPGRNTAIKLNVTLEAMVCHSGRFYSLPQFSVYCAQMAPARGEPAPILYGWSGQIITMDAAPVEEVFKDLAEFAVRNWEDHHSAMKWDAYTDEPEADIGKPVFSTAFVPI